MPTELRIPLKTDRHWWPDFSDQRGMHAIFLRAIKIANPILSEDLHNTKTNPYTQALHDGWQNDKNKLYWRITFLDDTLIDPFCDGINDLNDNTTVQGKHISFELDQLVRTHQSYEALAAVEPKPRYRFNFLTPTTFSKSVLHHPIPEPQLCYQSWWTRWQRFAPADWLGNVVTVDVAYAHLAISNFRIHSQKWQCGKIKHIGAVGSMTFSVLRQNKLKANWWQFIATLSAFSQYCGTGHKTSHGLGQTLPK